MVKDKGVYSANRTWKKYFDKGMTAHGCVYSLVQVQKWSAKWIYN